MEVVAKPLKVVLFLAILSVCKGACIDSCQCDDNICRSCDSSHIPCKKCPLGCQTCQSPDMKTCSECSDSYYLTESTCSPCPEGCRACKGLDRNVSCTLCSEGHYLKKSVCVPCSAFCSSCTCGQCQRGYYGEVCEKRCSDGCIDNICNKKHGHCSCKDGRYGMYCDRQCPETCQKCSSDTSCYVCTPGYYGNTCQQTCFGCRDGLCNKDTGECQKKRCNENYEGLNCDLYSKGRFGTYCNKTCPRNCAGCSLEFNCLACAEGLFGKKCEKKCPDECSLNICSRDTGECLLCKDGFKGKLCQVCYQSSCQDCPQNCLTCSSKDRCTECRSGYYGENCELVCPYGCVFESCFKVNGTCRYSCKDSFTGAFCQECTEGKYGENCSYTCPANCKCSVCDRKSGLCIKGCIKFMYGPKCETRCQTNCLSCSSETSCQECLVGYWGDTCSETCSSNCVEDCDIKDGSCTSCLSGLYGPNCNETCPEHCLNAQCSLVGHCQQCWPGRYGDQCEHNCSANCCNGACNQDGSCVVCDFGGERIALLSFTGLLLVVTVLMVVCNIYLRRKHAQRKLSWRHCNQSSHIDVPLASYTSDSEQEALDLPQTNDDSFESQRYINPRNMNKKFIEFNVQNVYELPDEEGSSRENVDSALQLSNRVTATRNTDGKTELDIYEEMP